MITFRCKILVLSATLIIGACSNETVEPAVKERVTEGIEVKKDGSPFNQMEFLKEYRANPNQFDDGFFKSAFTVSGFVKELSLYDPHRDLLNKVSKDREEPDYFIPLQSEDPFFDSLVNDNVDVSVWMSNFSREKASKLKVKKKIIVVCKGMRVVNATSITFDDCDKQAKDQPQ